MKKKRETLASLETSVGEAQVGGPFTLTDTAGKKFESAQLHGEFAILYFGFTHCPDICPDELEKMAAALDLVGAPLRVRSCSVELSRSQGAYAHVLFHAGSNSCTLPGALYV